MLPVPVPPATPFALPKQPPLQIIRKKPRVKLHRHALHPSHARHAGHPTHALTLGPGGVREALEQEGFRPDADVRTRIRV